ncbi:MAG: NAD(P)/FAD-dependent oxidoreductase [Myxococcales bacterium]|nr:MAG: NAD(P)/FAD-dependent oxidoreductase [Myxococcales bacterium]
MSLAAGPRPASAELGFDPDALREKYRQERDKRLRPDANDQYRQIAGELAGYMDDPHVEPGFTRDALDEETLVAIVGGGFSGLLAGVRLREAGVRDLRVIETGADFGGTWYWNRYPGVQCDIESYIYLPLLEELGSIPKEKYSYGPEIWAHAQAIGRHYDLYEGACFQTRVTEMRWDEAAARWILSTDRGDRIRARFVVMAIGPLSRPKLPGIPGVESFEGHSFHTSRWDYAYTGGDTKGKLTGLCDKRVGLIGTGATAVQCVPHLAETAAHLYVFQRTPSSIDVRGNRPTDPEWVKSLEPGWQQRRIDNFSILVSGGFQEVDLVSDGWTDIIRNLSGLAETSGGLGSSPEEVAAKIELADFQKMEQIRARVDTMVSDPATAEALKPYYRQFCKRPCFHDDYLPSFERPNVTLVDTQGKGVEAITGSAVVVAGSTYEVDCLIYASGFEVGTDYARRAGFEIVGRQGLTLTSKWAKGVATFHGLQSHGFPNCFFMGGIQSGVTPNFTELYCEQSQHIAYVIEQGLKRGLRTLESSQQAEADWVRTIHERAAFSQDFQNSCTPGYYNNEGKPGEGPGWFGGNYGGGAQAFFEILRTWRARNDLAGLDLA